MNTFADAMNFRHATKLFDENKKINDNDIRFILEMGRLSPSSFGLEPWKFLVVESDELKAKLKPTCWNQPQITSCSHLVIILFRKACNFEKNSDYLVRTFSRKFSHDPAQLDRRQDYFLGHRLNEARADNSNWAQMQCYIASGNMMTAAASLQIDSCPLEGFDYKKKEAVLAEYAPDVFNDKEFGVCHSIAFGYRANAQQERTRWDFDDVVSFI